MGAALVPLITAAIPEFFALIREKHAAANPGAPPITDDQIHAAMLMWSASTIAKDNSIINSGG